MAARPLLFALSALLVGCFDPGSGIEPPSERIYFPVGLALDSDARFLYVANSDFDLQYNAGTLQSLDLDALRSRLPRHCQADVDCASGEFCDLAASAENSGLPSHSCLPSSGAYAGAPCAAFGERPASDKALHPGRCGHIDPVTPQDGGPAIMVDSVEIGAFATDVLYRARPSTAVQGPPGRLFVPVRGDATLHWLDVDGGALECGQASNAGACDDRHRSGDDPDRENTRDLRLLPEPFAVDAPRDARALMVTNQTSGAVSLFAHDWSDAGPSLQFAVGDLPSRPIGVASVPVPLAARVDQLSYFPGFLVTFRNSASVVLVRAYLDGSSDPERPYARAVSATSIATNSVGVDSRGIAIDSSTRQTYEADCVARFGVTAECLANDACVAGLAPEFGDCAREAAAVPLDVYVSNRAPASLLVGQSRIVQNDVSSDDLPSFTSNVPLSLGPSRVVLGEITNADGLSERRVFIVCFDSRRIFIYDPVRNRLEAQVITGRGPHALAVDGAHGLAYVGHFTDSFIGVISLDQRSPETYATIVATVAQPTEPRASK